MNSTHKKEKKIFLPPEQSRDFSLFETLLWEDNDYFLLDLHKKRLRSSAHHFAFRYMKDDINRFLDDAAFSFDNSEKYRVKLTLKESGKIALASSVLDMPDNLPVKAAFSDARTDKNDSFLYHKTTKRKLYERELAKARTLGFFDVIFLNTEDEVTEGAITNILVQKDEKYFTPPTKCGLLPGVYREHLIKRNLLPIEEKVLSVDDIMNADKLFLINSVRKILPVKISR